MEALILTKSLLYLLLILILVFYTQTKPINETSTSNYQMEKMQWSGKEQKRQVVQPKWLREEEDEETTTVIDPIVRVTPERLKEIEAIRKQIQKAVKENTYVVKGYQPPNGEIPAEFTNGSFAVTKSNSRKIESSQDKEKSESPSRISNLCFRNLLLYKSPEKYTPVFRTFWDTFMEELARVK